MLKVDSTNNKKSYVMTKKGRDLLNKEFFRLKQLVFDGERILEGKLDGDS